MVTRNPGSPDVAWSECTSFSLHTSQHPEFALAKKQVIDFNERKLSRHALTIKDAQQRLFLMALVDDYVAGNVAIGWFHGEVRFVRVTRDD